MGLSSRQSMERIEGVPLPQRSPVERANTKAEAAF